MTISHSRILFILAMATAFVIAPLSLAQDDEAWGPRIESAQLVSAIGQLETAHDALTKAIESGSADDADRYDHAYSAWRLNQALYAADDDTTAERRMVLLESARETLEDLVNRDPEHVEAYALLGGVYGELIGDSRLRGMRLGPKANRALDRAHRLDADNPRVALQRGVSYFHTPSMFGGGMDKAIAELERARSLFADQGDETPWPWWGQVDAYAWLGQALAKEGRVDDARVLYREALAIEPDAGWIRFALLPGLDSGS